MAARGVEARPHGYQAPRSAEIPSLDALADKAGTEFLTRLCDDFGGRMTGFRLQINPRSAFRAVLAAGLLVMLGANLPGHLSYDSVAQLYEGHFHLRETWGPALYAWILGVFDAVVPGTALYVTASGLLFKMLRA